MRSSAALEADTEIDIRAANSYFMDTGWIDLPILDRSGQPAQRRGVTSAPGIYFLGLAWMHKVKSSFLYGVGEDAKYLAERLCETPATRPSTV